MLEATGNVVAQMRRGLFINALKFCPLHQQAAYAQPMFGVIWGVICKTVRALSDGKKLVGGLLPHFITTFLMVEVYQSKLDCEGEKKKLIGRNRLIRSQC